MTSEEFVKLVKRIVAEYAHEELDEDDIFDENVHIVWLSKALGNYKATAITDLNFQDKIYYELTYNGENGLIYLDVYKKQSNKCVISDVVFEEGRSWRSKLLYE